MKKVFLIFLTLFALISSVIYYLTSASIINNPTGYIYEVKPNVSAAHVKTELTKQLQLSFLRKWILDFYAWIFPACKSGEYFFKQGTSLHTLWRQITHGTGLLYHPFIIVPGWSFQQLKQHLIQEPYLRHTLTNLSDDQLMKSLGQTGIKPEGMFFPETYFFTKGITDKIILKHALKLMNKQLEVIWKNRAKDLPYKNVYEVLIAASLIEKEAYLNDERRLIAGVLVNRLRKNMLLQIDASVIYGLETYTGKIYKKDLQTFTPYNTYLHTGLPPTPIAMPGKASLEATVHPLQHNYYYYVARQDGSHVFSKTLVEHQQAVKNRNNNYAR